MDVETFLFCIASFVIGFILFLYGLYLVKRAKNLQKNPIYITGEITAIDFFRGGKNSLPYYRIDVSYVVDDFQYEGSVTLSPEDILGYVVGSKIALICQEDFPENVRCPHSTHWEVEGELIFLDSFFLLFRLFSIQSSMQLKRRRIYAFN